MQIQLSKLGLLATKKKKKGKEKKTDKQAKLIVGESKLAPLCPIFGSLVKTDKLTCVCFSVMGHCLSFHSLYLPGHSDIVKRKLNI